MAAKEPQKKQRWYKLIAQAYQVTRPHDKALLPLMLAAVLGTLAVAVAIGFIIGGTVAIVYASITGVLFALLAGLFTLTRRFEKTAFKRMEGMVGGSLSVAQSIRRGWSFEEEPAAIDPRGKAVVFRGVGRGGVMLLAEGGNASKKMVAAETRRITKLVPGVPVHTIYVGTGADQVPIKRLVKTIKKRKRVLSKREMQVVAARLHAIGGQKLPVPKGIDPMKARPNRKAMRG